MTFETRVQLMMLKVEILKLKADDYNWQTHTPKDVKAELEATLSDINENLNAPRRARMGPRR